MMRTICPPVAAMDPISLEDLALLEVLKKVDQGVELGPSDTELRQRLIDSALANDDTGQMRLTLAGIELCQSLQHRVAADVQAARIRERREQAEAASGKVAGTSNGGS